MDIWYYEYEVIIMDEDVESVRQGVICGESFGEVANLLDDYYRTELIRINKIACIVEGVYEFNGPEAEFKVAIVEGRD